MNVLLKTLIAAAVSVALLVPAAGAVPDPGAGGRIELDPALAAAVGKGKRDQRLDPALANAVRQARAARAERDYLLEHVIDPDRIRALRHEGSAGPRTLDVGLANALRDAQDRAASGAGSREAAAFPNISDRFHWGDAGVGAGSALGVVLLMLAGVVLVRRRRGKLTAA